MVKLSAILCRQRGPLSNKEAGAMTLVIAPETSPATGISQASHELRGNRH